MEVLRKSADHVSGDEDVQHGSNERNLLLDGDGLGVGVVEGIRKDRVERRRGEDEGLLEVLVDEKSEARRGSFV